MNLTILGGGTLSIDVFSYVVKNMQIKKVNFLLSKRHSEELYKDKQTVEFKIREIIKNNPDKKIFFDVVTSINNEIFEKCVSETDIQLSISAPWIYKQKHIDLCPNLIQLHCTSLPTFRGGGHLTWRILSGINYSSVVLFKVDTGIDTGEMVLNKKFFFPKECHKPQDYITYIHYQANKSIQSFLKNYISTKKLPKGIAQQESFSTYFPRLDSMIHGFINWEWDAKQVEKFITAFDNPYPGAITKLTNYENNLHLKGALLLEEYGNFHPFQQGLIFRKDSHGIYICSINGSILVSEVINEKGKKINDEINIGERFYNLSKDIEKAFSTRVKYTSKGLKNK